MGGRRPERCDMHTENTYACNEGGNWRVMAADENGAYTVADMCCDDQEANARLFAAAPTVRRCAEDVIRAFEMLGTANGIADEHRARRECERAMLALKHTLTPNVEVTGSRSPQGEGN